MWSSVRNPSRSTFRTHRLEASTDTRASSSLQGQISFYVSNNAIRAFTKSRPPRFTSKHNSTWLNLCRAILLLNFGVQRNCPLTQSYYLRTIILNNYFGRSTNFTRSSLKKSFPGDFEGADLLKNSEKKSWGTIFGII